MKKVGGRKLENTSNGFKKLENAIDKLAEMMLKGFTRVDTHFDILERRMGNVEKTMATKADILELHDKFIHRREFDSLSLRVSKLEEKVRR